MSAQAPGTALQLRPTFGSLSLATAGGLLGALLLAAGPLLPWLTLYAGNIQLRGIDGLPGLALSALGLAALVITSVFMLRGRPIGSAWRLAQGLVGVAALLLIGYLVVQLVVTFRQLAADPLLLAGIGPGLFVSATGAGLIALAAGLPLGREGARLARPSSETALRVVGAGGLLIAGFLHLILAPAHIGVLPVLGIGFLATGLAQAAFALALVGWPSRRILLGAIGVTAVPLLLWGLDATVGLPLIGHEAAHAVMGEHWHAPGEAQAAHGVDPAALATKSAELVALLAVLVLGRRPLFGSSE